MSGETINYTDNSMMALSPLFVFVGLGLFALMISYVLKDRKSKDYRKIFVDMFVVGRIKQLAKEHNINLNDELKAYHKFKKTNRNKLLELDDKIEEDTIERIDLNLEELEKKLNKETKKE